MRWQKMPTSNLSVLCFLLFLFINILQKRDQLCKRIRRITNLVHHGLKFSVHVRPYFKVGLSSGSGKTKCMKYPNPPNHRARTLGLEGWHRMGRLQLYCHVQSFHVSQWSHGCYPKYHKTRKRLLMLHVWRSIIKSPTILGWT